MCACVCVCKISGNEKHEPSRGSFSLRKAFFTEHIVEAKLEIKVKQKFIYILHAVREFMLRLFKILGTRHSCKAGLFPSFLYLE